MSEYREKDERIVRDREARFREYQDRLLSQWVVLVMIALTALRISWTLGSSGGP